MNYIRQTVSNQIKNSLLGSTNKIITNFVYHGLCRKITDIQFYRSHAMIELRSNTHTHTTMLHNLIKTALLSSHFEQNNRNANNTSYDKTNECTLLTRPSRQQLPVVGLYAQCSLNFEKPGEFVRLSRVFVLRGIVICVIIVTGVAI